MENQPKFGKDLKLAGLLVLPSRIRLTFLQNPFRAVNLIERTSSPEAMKNKLLEEPAIFLFQMVCAISCFIKKIRPFAIPF